MARRIRLTLSYDGTDYHGWQVQPGLPTIQGTLETVLSGIEGKPVQVVGSGRTDAGVHAYAQVAAVTLDNPIPAPNLLRALNRLLPADIRVINAAEVHDTFHPRFDATGKTYEYRIFRDEICPPFDRRYVWHHPYPLDEPAMIAAAAVFVGDHDFTAFAAADEKDALGGSKVRTIYSSTLTRAGSQFAYRVRGSGFLKHMVRNIVGGLIEVGRGNLNAADLQALLEAGAAARKLGHAAPSRGLFLISVDY
ncbi:MAG: tRNA pseudouridine(38-40) synthase TruA [Bryobacterales bacterium]|nr:tRNA pseudouridine(38-40) synthase TruA [Bryobacterales bacterium]